MTKKIQVDIETVRLAQAVLATINRMPLDQIEWCEHGQPISVPKENFDRFRFTGLSNCSFVEVEGWRDDAFEDLVIVR